MNDLFCVMIVECIALGLRCICENRW